MTYKHDPILPILQAEVAARTAAYAGLTAAEESKMLSLNGDQKKLISENDKRDKLAFLSQVPNINHPTVKAHEKYVQFADSVKSAAH